MKSKLQSNPFLRSASLAAIALTLGTAGALFLDSAHAGSATWTNGSATNVLNTPGNWSAGGPPNASGDTATWDGTAADNLVLTYNAIFGVATLGTTIDITSSQAGSISIGSTNAATNTTFALQNFTIASGAFSGVASGPGFFFGGGSGFDQMTFRNNSGAAPYTNTLTNNSDKTATFGNDVTFSSGNASARTLVFAGTGNWDVNSNLSVGNFSVTKQDAGTLTLAVTNTYSGLTTVTGGALNIGSSGSIRSGNALTVGANGTADFANAGQTLGAVNNANTATNALNFSAATGTVTLASLAGTGNTSFGSNGTVTGGISTGTVNAVGLLTASISGGTVGAGSLSSTTVSGGATTVSGIATIGTMSSGTANLDGATSAITTLNGGTVNLGSSTVLTVNDGTTSGTITGATGALTKSSSGTLTLAAANSYVGATTVNGGKLTISSDGNINSTSGVSIGAGELNYNSATALTKGVSFSSTGGTLSGTGTITPAVTVSSGNTLAPGSVGGIGTLSTGATTAIAGTYACDLDAAASDELAVTGTLDLTGATLAVNALATPAAATYTIASCTSGITGSFTGLGEGATLAISGVNYTISYAAGGGNQVTLTKATASGYTTWADANGATGQTVDQDHDTDGVKNGIEYFMGESGSGFTAQPALNASNIITWTMADAYNGVYGTDYQVQTSGDLTTWAPVDAVDVTIDNTAPGKSVSYTLTGSGPRFVRLLVNPN